MSAGIALILISLAQQLKRIAEQMGAPGEPGAPPEIPVPLPVQIQPEPSQIVLLLEYFSGSEIDYQEVYKYVVPKGCRLYLDEVSIAPDDVCKTYGNFWIKVGSAEVKDIRLLTTLTVGYGGAQLFEGAEVSIYRKSTNIAQTVAGNACLSGRLVMLKR